jgi:general secretion pathway protein J
MKHRQNAAHGGFTLIELLVAITLVVSIAALLGLFLRLGFGTVEKGERAIDRLERYRNIITLLDAQVQAGIYILGGNEQTEANRVYFRGDRSVMAFLTNHSLWSGPLGYVHAVYSIGSDKDAKKTLVLKEYTVMTGEQKSAVLFDGCEDITFSYYGKPSPQEQAQWFERWELEIIPPEALGISLRCDGRQLSLQWPLRVRDSVNKRHSGIPDGVRL